ncbi:MAG: GNAT family N-acetyltransferase [Candidatus Micrarchaeota archaeon]|nr:GNAT family N-acetyltransferase [Candidatus Micrarchaeota archaeon]
MSAFSQPLIRRIEERDFERVSEITNYHFPHVRVTPSKILKRLSKGFDYFVVVVDGVVAGFADFKLMERKVKLMGLAVDPEFRQMGIGSALLAKICEVAVREGKSAAYLQVKQSNPPAIKLYQRNGFVITREVEKGAESFYVMSKSLET